LKQNSESGPKTKNSVLRRPSGQSVIKVSGGKWQYYSLPSKDGRYSQGNKP